jgi:hypothetical protein
MVSNSYIAKRCGKSISGVLRCAFPSDFVILHDTFCQRGPGAPISREKQRDRLVLAYTNSDRPSDSSHQPSPADGGLSLTVPSDKMLPGKTPHKCLYWADSQAQAFSLAHANIASAAS